MKICKNSIFVHTIQISFNCAHYSFPKSTHVCDAGTLKSHVILCRIYVEFTDGSFEVASTILHASCPASVDKSDCVYESVSRNSNISMCTVRVVRPVDNDLHHLILALLCFTAWKLYWNCASAWMFSCKFAACFHNTFLLEHLWRVASKIDQHLYLWMWVPQLCAYLWQVTHQRFQIFCISAFTEWTTACDPFDKPVILPECPKYRFCPRIPMVVCSSQ